MAFWNLVSLDRDVVNLGHMLSIWAGFCQFGKAFVNLDTLVSSPTLFVNIGTSSRFGNAFGSEGWAVALRMLLGHPLERLVYVCVY